MILVLTSFNFLLIHTAPGGPLSVLAGETTVDPEYLKMLAHQYGLDRPLLEQYLVYMSNFLRGDLGRSYFFGGSVVEVIFSAVPATFLLIITSMMIGLLIGIPLGVISAGRHLSKVDNLVSLISLAFYSTPLFFAGIISIWVFSVLLHLLPAGGETALFIPFSFTYEQVIDRLSHLLLPSMTMAICVFIPSVSRLVRVSMLDALSQDYVMFARAAGLKERSVFFRHALRNALLPLVTNIGVFIAMMFGGAVLTETVFSWPGLGRLMFDSVSRRDYPIIMGMLVFIALGVYLVTLAVDILYTFVDPRIKYK